MSNIERMFVTYYQAREQPEPAPDEESGGRLSDHELVEELASYAAHLAVAECHYVLLIAEFDRRGIWADPGTRSCAHWLNWRCGTSLSAAREQVRVGRALENLPLVRSAFASGEISYSKVRAITRIATPENEAQLVEWAGLATASQLELIVRCHRRASACEGLEALDKHHARYLRTCTDCDGMVVIQARLSPEDGAVVLGAIEAAREAAAAPPPPPEPDVSAETSTRTSAETCEERDDRHDDTDPDVSAETPGGLLVHVNEGPEGTGMARADALVEVCRSVLEQGISSSEEEPRVNVMLHVDEKVLEDPAAEGCSYVESVGAVSSHTARRLTCDAGIVPLVYRGDGQVESEGMTRSIPRQMRRSVLARDDGCRWPACTQRRFVEVHHVVFWSRGGRTVPSNLVTICRFHHRLVHEGGYRLERSKSGQIRVYTPEGKEIPAVPPRKKAFGPDLAHKHQSSGLTINGETMRLGYAEPFDVDTTTEWLGSISKHSGEYPSHDE